MPATSSQRAKKGLPKSKMKEGLDLNASKHSRESMEKQLEDEERLFEEQSMEAGESTDIRGSDLEEDEGLSSDNFSTPKGRFANTRSKAKNSAEVINSPTNLTRRNTKKRSVEDTFSSPTPGPTKTARRSQQPTISDSFYTRQHEGKLLGLLEVQGEEIKELKELVNSQVKELADLKSMIKGMAKDVLSTKDTSKKAESTMASHLASLHLSNRQTAPERNPGIAPIHSTPKSVASGSQIALDLSQCELEAIQKFFAEIQQIFHLSISTSQRTEGIKIKGMNKDAKREHRYFVFFHTPEDEAKARIHNKWITSYFLQAKIQSPISFPIKVNRARANAVLDVNTGRVADYAKDSVSNSNGGPKIT